MPLSPTALKRAQEKGPVQILCEEIGYEPDQRLERPELLVSFLTVLTDELAGMVDMHERIRPFTGGAANTDAAEAIERLRVLLAKAPALADGDCLNFSLWAHDRTFGEPGGPPCNHMVDIAGSINAALWFSFEKPWCASRHAASAAGHLWKHKYGVSLFDEHTPKWQNDWIRAQFHEAVLRAIGGR